MKKLLIVLFMFLLTGCNFNKDVIDEEYLKYQTIENNIIEKNEFKYASQYYDVEIEMSKIENNTYRYYLTILNPRVAMYDIVIAAKDVKDFNTDEIMMPSKGIFDELQYNIIPDQYNPEKGYVEGIVLSGLKTFNEGEVPYIDLKLYVNWKNKDHSIETTEYLQAEYTFKDSNEHEELSEEEKQKLEEENEETEGDE